LIERFLHKSISIVAPIWTRHHVILMRLATNFMALAAIVWLVYEFWRLLWQTGEMGAIDLKQRYEEVQYWFTGRPVYKQLVTAVYPPASYVMLWPLLGWLGETAARWFWALTTIITLTWLTYLTVRESRAKTPLEMYVVSLIPLSMYATGATIGNGQLAIHVLPCLINGLLLLRKPTPKQESIAVVMILFALVKPTISAPFFWIVLFVARSWRPALFVSLGYVVLTLIASLFQNASPDALIFEWLARGREGVDWGVRTNGTTSLPSWSFKLNFQASNLLMSYLALAILGAWTYFHRKVELWLLLGVSALVARFWTYHGWYDDLLILLPAIALFRLAKTALSPTVSYTSGMLLFITVLSLIAPGGLYLLPSPWSDWYVTGQTIIWTIVMIFLLHQAWQQRRTTGA
jgi:hypothetical protein